MAYKQSRFPKSRIKVDIIEPEEGLRDFKVNFKAIRDDDIFEIEGSLVPFDDGRKIDYKFDPSYYSDKKAESFFEENWEDIEDEIIDIMLLKGIS
jgi:hypothetical protein